MSDNELLERDLPKWPQMVVTGSPVTKEQALEIIRRTDSFMVYQGGSNRPFIREAVEILRLPGAWWAGNYESPQEWRAQRNQWAKKWGYIETSYVVNAWISSSFIGGPHGWCHPDGTIGYIDNVGCKWPIVAEVYLEWKRIAEAFPFLELEVTLMDGEGSENPSPVVSMLIRRGKVKLVDPEKRNLHKEFDRPEQPERDIEECVKRIVFGGPALENAISLEQLQKWADQVFSDQN